MAFPKTAIGSGFLLILGLLLSACGGGGGGSSVAPAPPPVTLVPPGPPLVRVSSSSPFLSNCNGAPQAGTLYPNAEVEPRVAVNPVNPANIIGAWQQDRWSTGGAQGLIAGASFDSGNSWVRKLLKVSRCAGGNLTNGGDYERASDVWVTFSPNGVAYALSLSFGSAVSAMLVVRSTDGGNSWSDPITLINDGSAFFNDKGAITADSNDSNFVYAVWDRLDSNNAGPAYFARTINGGLTWEAARAIYDPGINNQTLGNEIAVLPDGTILDFFTEINNTSSTTNATAHFSVIRSTDQGSTWSAPIKIADELAVGATDPATGQTIRDGAGLGQIAVGPGGELYVVWQDARFTNGLRDGIVISSSTDGGLSWSTPTSVNGDLSVQAFTPSIDIRADGMIGISYYDLRDDTSSATTLLADYWLAQSSDGINWSEKKISGPFDVDLAPNARGLFMGDYQGLGDTGGSFLPFFVQTNNNGIANRTDVYTLPPQSTPFAANRVTTMQTGGVTITPEFRRRVAKNLANLLRNRIVRRPGTAANPPVQP